tara:strand:- start:727 stop:900 length:174 start_codon:yes stop_codon:yes gene_type:complete
MAKTFRVDAGFNNPDVSRTFLWIQFGVFTGLNVIFFLIFLLYKYNTTFHSVITGRAA